MLDGSKAGKSKSRPDDSQASKNAAALSAADAAKKRAEALIAEAMSQARTLFQCEAANFRAIRREACKWPHMLLLSNVGLVEFALSCAHACRCTRV